MTEEKIEKVLEAACEICKWPSEYKDPDEMFNDKCDSCPVAAAMEGDEETVTGIFDEEELIPNCTIQIWRNSQTGDVSVGWMREGEEPPIGA